ncbi:MAG: AraC family transcriptional regulator [Candidatus Competibacteraceae bacterium]|nr:AraC family transcriptional regulator [Candidatus Competibacteraceae bacterium]
MNADKFAEVNEADHLEGRPITLADQIARWTAGKNRFDGPVPGLALHRWETPTESTSYLLPPSLCLIGQGRKRLFLGEEAYVYDAHRYLMTSVDLPVVTQIVEASRDKPYLGLTLELDLRMAAQVMLGRNLALARPADCLGVAVSPVSPRLLDAFQRLIDLLEHPQDIAVLAPLVQQEIIYHLLMGEQGPRLRQITSIGNHSYRIARAIDWLKDHFDQRLRIEDLANKAGLSTSAFHSHFRSVTSMSPLQFQKKMRLNEARRLMLTEHMDAATAAYAVGYDSPSQFSREYSRQFGVPPMRDIKNLIQVAAV